MRWPAFLSLVLLLSCTGPEKQVEILLPGSTGGSLEVLVVMDHALWEGSVGSKVREQFNAPMPGMPQEEAWYKLIRIEPKALNELLKRAHLIFMAEIDSSMQSSQGENLWSKPQMITSYRAPSEAGLLQQMEDDLAQHLKGIRAFERRHILKRIARQRQNASNSALLRSLQAQITLPINFELDTDLEDLSIFWSRNQKSDQCLMIHRRPLDDDLLLLGKDILPVRDSLCKTYVPGQFDGTYMTTEYRLPPSIETSELDGRFALETRGLWRVEGDFMGGPFLSYTLFDEENGQIVTLEGFVYAPDMDKRRLLFELEAIMNSLKLP